MSRIFESMKTFLSSFNLYEPQSLGVVYKDLGNRLVTPFDFEDKTFDYYCVKNCNKETSFILKLQNRFEISQKFEGCGMDSVPQDYLIDGSLNYTTYLKGKCQSCNNYYIDLIVNIYTERQVPTFLIGPKPPRGVANTTKNYLAEMDFPIFACKIGLSPKKNEIPKLEVTKFFDRESNTWYYKGINAIAENFGIGALAYFRRIIEKELLHIIRDIKELPDAHGMEIQKLLDDHAKQNTVSSIYDNIFNHLPNSLKALGDNPIKLLYNQTSEGLHSLTEEQALEKSRTIQKLLEFVIVKINEERSNIKDLKEAINGLKS